LHRTQSNVDVNNDTQIEDSSITKEENNILEEEEDQTESELSNTERAVIKRRRDSNKEGVDKIITFLKEKNDKKQAGELEFFFASACESTKLLPRHLQLKVKVEVMKAVIDAETECLNYEQLRSPTPSINCENL
jgi:hypothetical protein